MFTSLCLTLSILLIHYYFNFGYSYYNLFDKIILYFMFILVFIIFMWQICPKLHLYCKIYYICGQIYSKLHVSFSGLDKFLLYLEDSVFLFFLTIFINLNIVIQPLKWIGFLSSIAWPFIVDQLVLHFSLYSLSVLSDKTRLNGSTLYLLLQIWLCI